MAKTKTPFFSFGAHGSVGESITAQRRASATLLREKPLPTDPYSLPQAYQRWLYQDYSYLWTQQSQATRAEYRRAGSRFHLTPFQYWIKYQLTNLPDIVAYWKLDDNLGATTRDSSRNLITATIIGASPAAGLIGKALDFDGLNNRLNCTNNSLFDITGAMTIELCFTISGWTAHKTQFSKGDGAEYVYQFFVDNVTRFARPILRMTDATTRRVNTPALDLDTWYHIVASWDGTTLNLYMNGAYIGQDVTGPETIRTTNEPLWIGYGGAPGHWHEGIIDHVILRNRALDAIEGIRNSARGYPA